LNTAARFGVNWIDCASCLPGNAINNEGKLSVSCTLIARKSSLLIAYWSYNEKKCASNFCSSWP